MANVEIELTDKEYRKLNKKARAKGLLLDDYIKRGIGENN